MLLVAYSPDGDPLALVEISREEAARLVSLPEAMGHLFHAAERKGGEVHIEAVPVDGVTGYLLSA
ncbi:MAG: hypothetical protein U1G08_02285 [Verrucomicrobiota bacterium]